MHTYRITYTRPSDDREIITHRKAEMAYGAIEKLCDQYGWRFDLNMYDADTRGEEWAQGLIDPEGGLNFRRYVIAEMEE